MLYFSKRPLYIIYIISRTFSRWDRRKILLTFQTGPDQNLLAYFLNIPRPSSCFLGWGFLLPFPRKNFKSSDILVWFSDFTFLPFSKNSRFPLPLGGYKHMHHHPQFERKITVPWAQPKTGSSFLSHSGTITNTFIPGICDADGWGGHSLGGHNNHAERPLSLHHEQTNVYLVRVICQLVHLNASDLFYLVSQFCEVWLFLHLFASKFLLFFYKRSSCLTKTVGPQLCTME